ncbi:hypothetical protein [Mesorhizobium carmichaelinearum]|uniref:hypothetical protein n=1 Tax=Mesorhizobium carmichaelinearum TaxID=1208188 RepID=UPI0015CB2346|nr:hypothetical protein [Mesorhizobium carmichaelinearum]
MNGSNDCTSFIQRRFDHRLEMARGCAARADIARSDQLDECLTAQIMAIELGMVDAKAAPAPAHGSIAEHMVEMAKADHDACCTHCRVASHHLHEEGAGMEAVRPLGIEIAIELPHSV